jgi:hypothetical protein
MEKTTEVLIYDWKASVYELSNDLKDLTKDRPVYVYDFKTGNDNFAVIVSYEPLTTQEVADTYNNYLEE